MRNSKLHRVWHNIFEELAIGDVELSEAGSCATAVDRFVSCNLTSHISRRSESFEQWFSVYHRE